MERIQLFFGLENGWYNCSSWGELDAKCPEILGEIEIIYEDGKNEGL